MSNIANTFADFEQIEKNLWEAADQLRANSKLSSSEYCMPVLGVIFLRQATNRFDAVTRKIEADRASGKSAFPEILPQHYVRERAMYLPERARYDVIQNEATGGDLPSRITEAMELIEEYFPPLKGILPKEYGIFEKKVLEDLMRLFSSDALKAATGDLFGRIYEYFLMKFAMQGAQDNGEFFTPPSLVQTIVNVIEPEHGTVFDPACGSGGMFVQTSHFIEKIGLDTAKRVVFYGQEKTATTIRLAIMNLAVHGLDGHIVEANTFYQDEHTLVGKCDFVMANPPFNVDMVDASRAEQDKERLPFGLPGVNKDKKVSNGNYLWVSYFWSYLKESGRAGFVMSSQTSSAGNAEKTVRQKVVETGDVDVMMAIRANFFYTRSVPCELWFFDKGKPEARRDSVLMLDARNVYRKVTRKIYDFSPEQMSNLSSIVWLYRGQNDRFLDLVRQYLGSVKSEGEAIAPAVAAFDAALAEIVEPLRRLSLVPAPVPVPTPKDSGNDDKTTPDITEARTAFLAAFAELETATTGYNADAATLAEGVGAFNAIYPKPLPATNESLLRAGEGAGGLANRAKGVIKQIDLVYKLATRCVDAASIYVGKGETIKADVYDRRALQRQIKPLEEKRKAVVESCKGVAYFHRQMAWLQERFPDAELRDVPGLVRVVSRADIAAADWSLTPGRYVGVAPPETDEDFDFEETMRGIHTELADLNREAAELAAVISLNITQMVGE